MEKSILIRGVSEDVWEGLKNLADRDGLSREKWIKKRLEHIVATERSMHAGDLAQSVLNMRRNLGDVESPTPPHFL